jgi:hypothetical protein
MSEYTSSVLPKPTFESLDHEGTLFDVQDELGAKTDALVDDGTANYHEARIMTGVSTPGWPMPNPEQVSVSLVDRYIDELHLLEVMANMHMRAGLVNKDGQIDSVIERYGADVPKVVRGAERNMDIGNQLIRSIYRFDELENAGFDPEQLKDDIVQLKYAYRTEYMGPENKKKRARRRAFLKRKVK